MEILRINEALSSRLKLSRQSPFTTERHLPCLKKEVICKISFEIDEDEEELLIYDDTTLDMVTDELITKLALANLIRSDEVMQIGEEERLGLEEEIRQKIEVIIESCPDSNQKSIKWKNKLRKLISKQSEPAKDSQVFEPQPCSELVQRSNTVKYFGYNSNNKLSKRYTEQSDDRSIQIIQRAKLIKNSLEKKTKKSNQTTQQKNRLYDDCLRNNEIKQYLWKIRGEFLQNQQLSECTFQPTMIKPFIRDEQRSIERNRRGNNDSVFQRLYQEAMNKQVKMKIIQKQAHQKQEEALSNLKFIPKIDSCSRQIANLKKEINKNQQNSIYDDLYSRVFKKDKNKKQENNNQTFRPTICPKSQKIVKKVRAHQSQKQILLKENKTRRKTEVENHKISTRSKVKKNNEKDVKEKSDHLQKFQFLYTGISDRKAVPQNRNILGELRNGMLRNRSTKLNSFENSQQKSQSRRVETCQSENYFSKSTTAKMDRRSYKNIVDLSTIANDCSESGTNYKKSKENLYYLVTQDSTRNSHNNSKNFNKSPLSKKKTVKETKERKSNIKKSVLNPYQFFQKQERKSRVQNTTSLMQSVEEEGDQKEDLAQVSEQRRTELFLQIFKAFNHENVDQIDSSCISQSKILPSSLKNVFFPMAQEMKQLKVGLDSQEFMWSLSRIYDKLTPQQRLDLILWGCEVSKEGIS